LRRVRAPFKKSFFPWSEKGVYPLKREISFGVEFRAPLLGDICIGACGFEKFVENFLRGEPPRKFFWKKFLSPKKGVFFKKWGFCPLGGYRGFWKCFPNGHFLRGFFGTGSLLQKVF